MRISKTILGAAAAAVAFVAAGAADATVFNVGDDNALGHFKLTNGTTPFSPIITASFGADYNVTVPTAVDDSFLFTIPQTGIGSGNVSTSFTVDTNMLTISDVLFNGTSYLGQLVNTGSGFSLTINNLAITAFDMNALEIKGSVEGINGYSGNLTFATTPVPEPATWAMMVVGFGVLGAASRRSRVKTNFAM